MAAVAIRFPSTLWFYSVTGAVLSGRREEGVGGGGLGEGRGALCGE